MTSENHPQNTITVEDRIGKYSPELQKTKHGLILQAAADAIRDRYHITCNPEQTAEILRLFLMTALTALKLKPNTLNAFLKCRDCLQQFTNILILFLEINLVRTKCDI